MKRIFLITIFCFASFITFSQVSNEEADIIKDGIRNAENLRTGNSQDVLTSFYQLAIKDLIGNSHTFNFQSSIFAIKAKTDNNLWVDTSYLRQNFARNFNIGLALEVDSSFKFKSNALDLKYAIVNKRDKTAYDYAIDLGIFNSERVKIMGEVRNAYYKKRPVLTQKEKAIIDEYFDSDSQINYADLPASYQNVLDSCIKANSVYKKVPAKDFKNHLRALYENVSAMVEAKPLWTINAKLSSDANKLLFSKVNLNSEYLKGFIKKKSAMNLELDIKGSFDLYDDTASIKKDMNRQVGAISVGINWIILKDNKKQKSLLELKADAAGNYIFSGYYKGKEDRSFLSFNGNLRLRISDDIWLPVEIKYDPVSNNVFGFLNITTNFDWLGKKSGY